ncbi:hypothetical protein ABT093_19530 [Kitasatospora sp. NPDC002551]|uniref:hypothetical protein n=1 Tax=unclassified Kitasatospora TaxID=2633591 RepID=UPI00331A09A9
MLRMNGPLRITVLDKDAYYEQRVVVRAPYGTFVLEGRIGASLDVRADEWEMELQHCVPGVGWRPNVRVLPYPWQTSRSGVRSRIVRSKDCDWPNGDPTERNLILRLSGTVAERPGEAASPTEGLGPATRGGIRTSGGEAPAVLRGTVGGQEAAAVPAVPAVPVTGVPVAGTAVPGVPGYAGTPARAGAPAYGVPAYGAGAAPGMAVPVGPVQVPAARTGHYVAAVPTEAARVTPAQPLTAPAVTAAPVTPPAPAVPPLTAGSEGWARGW